MTALHRALVGAGSLLLASSVAACGSSASSGPDASVDASGQPELTALTLSGKVAAGPSGTMVDATLMPPYSPEIHDYSVRCGSGPNKISVSMTAASGSTSALVKPGPTSGSSPMQTVSVSVQPGDPIVASASNSKGSVDYWIRCLPSSFPVVGSATHTSVGTASPGYYIVGSLTPVNGVDGVGAYAAVLDGNGVPVWYGLQPMNYSVVDADSVIPHTLSFSYKPFGAAANDPHPNQPFTVVDLSTADQTTSFLAPTGDPVDNHEIQVTSSGTYVVFSYPLLDNVDLTGLTDTHGKKGTKSSTILGCDVVEFDKNGHEVSTWKASDHFDPKAVTTYLDVDLPGPSGTTIFDVFHCNSIDIDPANGNYLISARQMDAIFYVDKKTGNVLWKMGGKGSALDKGSVNVSVSDAFYRQHDARLVKGWQPDCNGGTGQISLFDDEAGRPSGVARGVVYDVVVGGGSSSGCTGKGGGKAGMATVSTQFKGQGTVALGGSVRIQSDGSTVVGWGLDDAAPSQYPILSEYDASGKDVLDMDFVPFDFSYRAIKVSTDAFDLANLHANAGKTLPAPP